MPWPCLQTFEVHFFSRNGTSWTHADYHRYDSRCTRPSITASRVNQTIALLPSLNDRSASMSERVHDFAPSPEALAQSLDRSFTGMQPRRSYSGVRCCRQGSSSGSKSPHHTSTQPGPQRSPLNIPIKAHPPPTSPAPTEIRTPKKDETPNSSSKTQLPTTNKRPSSSATGGAAEG